MHGSCTEVLHSSYTMGTSGLPDIYTRSLRAAGPRAEGVYIRQTTCAHGITIKCQTNKEIGSHITTLVEIGQKWLMANYYFHP